MLFTEMLAKQIFDLIAFSFRARCYLFCYKIDALFLDIYIIKLFSHLKELKFDLAVMAIIVKLCRFENKNRLFGMNVSKRE